MLKRLKNLSLRSKVFCDPAGKGKSRMNISHELKTDPGQFQAVKNGRKKYTIRWNDRGFAAGDILILRETTEPAEMLKRGFALEYSGRQAKFRVTHVLYGPKYGLANGWAILSIEPAEEKKNEKAKK